MKEKEIKLFSLEPGDLLFARQSLVASGAGKCSIVLEVGEITTFESHIIRVRLDKKQVNPLFYYYYFDSFEGFKKVQPLVTQVAAAGIRGSELARISLPVPPLQEQKKIATILKACDDEIDLLKRKAAALREQKKGLMQQLLTGKVRVKG